MRRISRTGPDAEMRGEALPSNAYLGNEKPEDDVGPWPDWYDPQAAHHAVLARESCRCEACGDEVDPHDTGAYALTRLRRNDYRIALHVLLCRSCADRPDWRPRVRRNRYRNRRHELAEKGRCASVVGRLIDDARSYATDPSATFLFGRRLLIGAGAIAALATPIIGLIMVFMAAIAPPDVARDGLYHLAEAAVETAVYLAMNPWVPAVGGGLAYAAHAAERGVYDPRGYTWDYPPTMWHTVAAGGGVAAAGLGGLLLSTSGTFVPIGEYVLGGRIPTPLAGAGLVAWTLGAALAAYAVGPSVIGDTTDPRLYRTTFRALWVGGVRLGTGAGALTVVVGTPAGSPPGVAFLLLAIAPTVALAYIAHRFPYDRRAVDRTAELIDRVVRRLRAFTGHGGGR